MENFRYNSNNPPKLNNSNSIEENSSDEEEYSTTKLGSLALKIYPQINDPSVIVVEGGRRLPRLDSNLSKKIQNNYLNFKLFYIPASELDKTPNLDCIKTYLNNLRDKRISFDGKIAIIILVSHHFFVTLIKASNQNNAIKFTILGINTYTLGKYKNIMEAAFDNLLIHLGMPLVNDELHTIKFDSKNRQKGITDCGVIAFGLAQHFLEYDFPDEKTIDEISRDHVDELRKVHKKLLEISAVNTNTTSTTGSLNQKNEYLSKDNRKSNSQNAKIVDLTDHLKAHPIIENNLGFKSNNAPILNSELKNSEIEPNTEFKLDDENILALIDKEPEYSVAQLRVIAEKTSYETGKTDVFTMGGDEINEDTLLKKFCDTTFTNLQQRFYLLIPGVIIGDTRENSNMPNLKNFLDSLKRVNFWFSGKIAIIALTKGNPFITLIEAIYNTKYLKLNVCGLNIYTDEKNKKFTEDAFNNLLNFSGIAFLKENDTLKLIKIKFLTPKLFIQPKSSSPITLAIAKHFFETGNFPNLNEIHAICDSSSVQNLRIEHEIILKNNLINFSNSLIMETTEAEYSGNNNGSKSSSQEQNLEFMSAHNLGNDLPEYLEKENSKSKNNYDLQIEKDTNKRKLNEDDGEVKNIKRFKNDLYNLDPKQFITLNQSVNPSGFFNNSGGRISMPIDSSNLNNSSSIGEKSSGYDQKSKDSIENFMHLTAEISNKNINQLETKITNVNSPKLTNEKHEYSASDLQIIAERTLYQTPVIIISDGEIDQNKLQNDIWEAILFDNNFRFNLFIPLIVIRDNEATRRMLSIYRI